MGATEDFFQPIFLFLHQLIQQYISTKSEGNIQLHTEFSKQLLEIKCKVLEARAHSTARFEESERKFQEVKSVLSELQKTLIDQQQEISRLGQALEEKEKVCRNMQHLIKENSTLKRYVKDLKDHARGLLEDQQRLRVELRQASILLQAQQATKEAGDEDSVDENGESEEELELEDEGALNVRKDRYFRPGIAELSYSESSY